MKSQSELKSEIVNRLNNHGIFIQEREIEYEGEEILVYMFMPESLAAKADVVANVIVYDYVEIEKMDYELAKQMEENPIITGNIIHGGTSESISNSGGVFYPKKIIEKPKVKPVPKKEVKKVKKK